MNKRLLLTLQLLTFCLLSFSNDNDTLSWFQKHPLSVSINNHTFLALPFHVPKYFHPGVTVGTEFLRKEKKRHSRYLLLNFGYYSPVILESGWYVSSDFSYKYFPFNSNFYFSPFFGLGYLHNFRVRQLYKLDKSSGEYKKARDFGVPSLYTDSGIELGIKFKSQKIINSAYFRYQWIIQCPYGDFSPIIPHQFIHIGLKITP